MNLLWYHRLICLWLAVFVLFGSSGHVVAEHWCKMKGRSVAFRVNAKSCTTHCQKKPARVTESSGAVVDKTPCCKDVEQFLRLAPSSLFSYKGVELNPPVSDWFDTNQPFHFRKTVLLSTSSAPSFPSDDPPIRSGRFRLIHHCRWLI